MTTGISTKSGGKVVPGKAVDPNKWAKDPNYDDIRFGGDGG